MRAAPDINTIALKKGSHPRRGKNSVCAMEFVAWMAGEKHSDAPACTSHVIAAFVRNWNDALSDDDRNRLLRPLLPRLIGTVGDTATEERRAYMAVDWFVREHTPAWLELAKLGEHAARVRALPEITDLGTLKACGAALAGARGAADAAWAAAGAAAWAAAGAAVERLQASAANLIERMIGAGQ